jgi:hypothetical protein
VFYHDPQMTRRIEPGDHICVFYSSEDELEETVAAAANALPPITRGTVDGKLGELHRLVTDVDRRARHRKPRG